MIQDGVTQVFTTYDYAVGAYDASAWFDSDEGQSRFTLTGYPDENPDAEDALLRLTAHLPQGRIAGSAGKDELVEVWLDNGRKGAKLTSVGHPAALVIDSFTPDTAETSGYGQSSGHFSAVLCPGTGDPAVVAPGNACRAVSGRFDTGVQYQP